MDGFERSFDEVTNSCELALKATQALTNRIRQLRKSSQVGNIEAMKREQARLAETLEALSGPVDKAINAWPYDDETEVEYLREGYAAELRSVALEKRLKIVIERDGQLISHPSIVRIHPFGKGGPHR